MACVLKNFQGILEYENIKFVRLIYLINQGTYLSFPAIITFTIFMSQRNKLMMILRKNGQQNTEKS